MSFSSEFARSLYAGGQTPPAGSPRIVRRPLDVSGGGGKAHARHSPGAKAATTEGRDGSSLGHGSYRSPQSPHRHGHQAVGTPEQYPSPIAPPKQTAADTPTGKWAHPAIQELALEHRVRGADDGTVRRVMYNGVAGWLIWRVSPWVETILLSILGSTETARSSLNEGNGGITGMAAAATLPTWYRVIKYAVVLLLVYNICEGLMRFVRAGAAGGSLGAVGVKAETALLQKGVALTPGQRKLLNLPPSAGSSGGNGTRSNESAQQAGAASSPARHVTPPRYPRNVTPSPASTTGTPHHGGSPAAESPSTRLSLRNAKSTNTTTLSTSAATSHTATDLGSSSRWRYSRG
ncbi:hypothetical protein PYCC9005_005903 [Savitreella phatthalungensis]